MQSSAFLFCLKNTWTVFNIGSNGPSSHQWSVFQCSQQKWNVCIFFCMEHIWNTEKCIKNAPKGLIEMKKKIGEKRNRMYKKCSKNMIEETHLEYRNRGVNQPLKGL